jgi:hypothetical protein
MLAFGLRDHSWRDNYEAEPVMFHTSGERMVTVSDRLGGRLGGDVRRLEPEVQELSLLLPQWQVEALEIAARGRGLTAGQLIRRLIGSYCANLHAVE